MRCEDFDTGFAPQFHRSVAVGPELDHRPGLPTMRADVTYHELCYNNNAVKSNATETTAKTRFGTFADKVLHYFQRVAEHQNDKLMSG